MEEARRATPDDLGRIEELAEAARGELGPMRGGAVFLAREARAQAVDPGCPDSVAYVGTIDGTVMAFATGRVEDLRDGTRLGVIDDLYVEEGARGVGLGEALMGALLPWFREQRCHGVDALALPGNRATKNFFESSGFSARLIVMHHKLAAE